MKKNNPDAFEMYDMMMDMRDECLEKSLQASIYHEMCDENPWLPTEELCADGLIKEEALDNWNFVNNLYTKTVNHCKAEEAIMLEAARQIEDLAYIKLTVGIGIENLPKTRN